jgi:hypothetical protein
VERRGKCLHVVWGEVIEVRGDPVRISNLSGGDRGKGDPVRISNLRGDDRGKGGPCGNI